ncbi:MAG: hypothetical protein V3S41_06450, partial [Spirochaetia bacterium]
CTAPRQTVDVLVTLPDTPDPWVDAWGQAGYRIRWQAYATVSGAVDVEPGVKAVILELPKATVVPVLAWPVWEAGGPALEPTETMRPAGGVWSGDGAWPDDEGGGGFHLSFENGPAVFVLNSAAGRGADVQAFNRVRLIEEISARLPDDPWLLDTDRIVRALCERSMRVSYIREAALTDVSLEVPDGTWYGTSPFGEPMEGGLLDRSVRAGLTPYYDDRGRRFVVVIDEEGRVWSAISPPD